MGRLLNGRSSLGSYYSRKSAFRNLTAGSLAAATGWEADMTNMVYLNSEPKEVSETCVSLGHLPNAAGEVVGQGSAPTS